MRKPKKEKLSIQEENSKRAAAGMAKATKGRSRVFKDRTKYDRKNPENTAEGD